LQEKILASEVDIANLALSHLGDSATVASLNPPEGSAQAEHCARFYPIARDSLLEMHSWGFATKRVSLALLTNTWPEWTYAYACPTDALNLLAVLAADAPNDYSTGLTNSGAGNYTPQDFSNETADDGTSIIFTNVQNATLRYSARITDTTKFSPLFVDALAWLLASYMAGPILKGDAGMGAARQCLGAFDKVYAKATVSDANQQRHTVKPSVSWMAGR
jgi:hypothetical protein